MLFKFRVNWCLIKQLTQETTLIAFILGALKKLRQKEFVLVSSKSFQNRCVHGLKSMYYRKCAHRHHARRRRHANRPVAKPG